MVILIYKINTMRLWYKDLIKALAKQIVKGV